VIKGRVWLAIATATAAVALVAPTSASADPVLAAAGDIACPPGVEETATQCHQAETAALVAAINPDAVLPLGDNQYEIGALDAYQSIFDATWGAFRSKEYPVPGNHEYYNVGAAGYYAYFGAAAGDPTKGYYSYDLGNWHLLALNSNCTYVPCGAGSEQERWVRAELVAHSQSCVLAYWHHSLWSSQGGTDKMKSIWKALTDGRADVVLSGHNHNYERFAPQTADGQVDYLRAPRQFTVGTGGRNISRINSRPRFNAQTRNDRVFGVLALTLSAHSYTWRYESEDGSFSDTGSQACHDKTAPAIRTPTLRPDAFRAASRGRALTTGAAAATGPGANLRFRLSERATVAYSVQVATVGQRTGGVCRPAKRAPKAPRRCRVWVTLPRSATTRLRGGHNRLRFSGRIGGQRLSPGRYRLVARPTDPALNVGPPVSVDFTIVR
jgi:hypothetical protein